MLRLRYTLLTALAVVARSAPAQRPVADTLPAPGTRVRVSTPPSRRVEGAVLAYRGDTILLRRPTWRGEEITSVLLTDARRLEVSVGKRRRVLSGALLGVTGGAAAGALVGAATYSNAPSRCYKDGTEVPCLVNLDFGRGFNTMVGGVLGGAVGLVVGLAVGARRVDRWEPVGSASRSSRLHVLPPTQRSGPGLAVAVGF